MNSTSNEEILQLVHSFLKESHLMKTARSLEQETGEVSIRETLFVIFFTLLQRRYPSEFFLFIFSPKTVVWINLCILI